MFTDVEGSTRMLQELGTDAYVRALEDHRRLLRGAVAPHGGVEVELQGDSFHFAFADPVAAVAAAAELQDALAAHAWETAAIRVRVGIHTGEPVVSDDLYAGLDLHRTARVMSAGHGGQVLVTERTRQLVGDAFDLRSLGEHRLKDLLEPMHLYQLGDGEFPPLKSLYRTNLPVPPTPFLGRTRELAEVCALVETSRLLTLTGPGGTGKTRLAVQAAAEAAESFPDGVYWVGLAAIRDPALVPSEIAQAVGATGDVTDHIAGRRLLLVLDNFEQLVAAAPALGDLISTCPNVAVVLTSREPLHLAAEHAYPVPALDEADAVALFRERARATGVEVSGNGEVAEICRRLDGLPLAIELAAARVKVLSPDMLLQRLDQRLPLLTGGPRDVPERQQTLRAAIAWSFDLLAPEEQRLFALLAAFSGGATVEAAEAVCAADLDSLQSLLEKSLLRQSGGRFWMLETIREYAAERLAELDDDRATQRRHLSYFVSLAERVHPELRGPNQARRLDEVEAEHDNFRTALRFALDDGEVEAGVRVAGVLARFWMIRGHLSEGRRWLEAMLEHASPSPARALALRGLSTLSLEQGDFARATSAAEEALALDRVAGDEHGMVYSLGLLADVVAFQGDLDTGKRRYEEAAALARRCGERLQLAVNVYNLGHVTRLQGDLDASERHFREAQALFEEVGDTMGQAGARQGLVEVASERGDPDLALALLAESIDLYARIGYVSGLLDALEQSGLLLAQTGQYDAAARLGGARQALSSEIGRDVVHPIEAAERDEAVASLRRMLGDEAFVLAWEAGASMSLEEAVAFAREQVAGQRPARARF